MSDSTQNPPSSDEPTASSGYPAPPPPQPAGQPMAPGVGQPADLMPRFLARLIDYAILLVVNVVLVFVIVAGVLLGAGAGGFGDGTGFFTNLVTSVLTAAIALGYFAFMESSRGQTVGKMALKIETRGPDGGRPTMEQAVRRNAFTAIGVIAIIPIVGGFVAFFAQLAAVILIAVTISKNVPSRRGWHDDFAGGTSVAKIG